MIHYGDITKISGYNVPIVDCVVGGSPCQNLSVAGNREGLDGDESKLFVDMIRTIKEMRDCDARSGRSGEFIRPRFAIWENVPGAFSSNKGQDFRVVLESFAQIVEKDASIPMPPKDKWTTSGCIVGDGWSIAWRVLDAQFWGVPQRRRRIALVADFGGGCAQEILFERQGLRRDSDASRTERKGASEDAQGCVGVYDSTGECDLRTSTNLGTECTRGKVVIEGLDAYNQCLTGDVALTLRSARGDNEHLPLVVMDRSAYNQGENAKFNIGNDENGVAFSHIAKGPGAVCCLETFHCIANEDGTCFTLKARDYKDMHIICLQGNQIDQADTSVCNGSGFKEGTSYTLNVRDRHAVAYGVTTKGNGDAFISEERHTSLSGGGGQAGQGYPCVLYQKPHYIVRRLTPLECERLQGYPDGWTDIGEYTDSKGKKKKTSDTARYKALGNSIALPPWKWIIKRLCSHYERDATLASLFDGIGGFPCLWEQINGKGSAVWASEIEDFPIAVTQVRIE